MRNTVTTGSRFCAAALVLAIFAGAVQAAPNPAEWAPDDAFIYIATPSVDDAYEAWKKTPAARMAEDPALKEIYKPLEDAGENFRKFVARKLNLDNPQKLDIRPHGPAVAYVKVSLDDNGMDQASAAMVLDFGEDISKVKEVADAVTEKSLEQGGKRTTEEIAGVTITSFTFPKEEGEEEDESDPFAAQFEESEIAPELEAIVDSLVQEEFQRMMLKQAIADAELPEEFAFAIIDSNLVVGDTMASASDAVRRIKSGGEKSMASSRAMSLLKEHCNPKAQVHIAVNLPVVIELAASQDEDSRKEIKAMNADAFGPIVATVEFGAESNVPFRLRGFFGMQGDVSKGLPRIFLMPNIPTAPSAAVGSDAAGFFSANVQPGTILDEIIAITARMDPDEAQRMRDGMKAPLPDNTVLDIQKDVVEQFEGPLTGFMSLRKPYGVDDVNMAVMLRHKSKTAIERLLSLAPEGMIQRTELLGSVIISSPMVPLPGLVAALTDRYAVLMATRPAAEGVIRSQERSGGGLAEDASFRRIADMLPREAAVVAYLDSGAVFDAQLALMKSGDIPDEPPMFAPMGQMLRTQLAMAAKQQKLNELADPSALKKYQGVMMGTFVTGSEGIKVDVVSVVTGE